MKIDPDTRAELIAFLQDLKDGELACRTDLAEIMHREGRPVTIARIGGRLEGLEACRMKLCKRFGLEEEAA